jgi:hypothetical protein
MNIISIITFWIYYETYAYYNTIISIIIHYNISIHYNSVIMASGNPRKFRHGIYLVYTWYILLAFVILVYTWFMTGICFLGKSIFVYHWMHVCMQWLLPKYTIHHALDGDLFSKSYIEFNISMVYDRHLLGIHLRLVYTTFVLVLILSE